MSAVASQSIVDRIGLCLDFVARAAEINPEINPVFARLDAELKVAAAGSSPADRVRAAMVSKKLATA